MLKVIHSLNERFPNLIIFNTERFLSLKYYPVNELDKRTLTEQWMDQFVTHFRWSDDLINQCNAEFVKMLTFREDVNRGMDEAWVFNGNDQ